MHTKYSIIVPITENKIYSVVSWDGVFWQDRFFYCVDVDYWTELPEVII